MKNPQDGRYLKNRTAINRVFLIHRVRGRDNIGVVQLCEEIGIHASTFYRHYENTGLILQGIEKTLFQQFFDSLVDYENLGWSAQNLQTFFRKLLIFVGQHPLYFKQACDHSETEWFLQIFQEVEPLLTGNWRPRQRQIVKRWYNLLCFELIGTIYDWGKNEQFELLMLPKYQKELVYLTETAESRFRYLDNLKANKQLMI